MGSPCEIQLYALTEDGGRAIANLAIADAERLEARYSCYRESSLLSGINRAAAEGGSVEVDEETAGLLDYARTCYEQSDGLFDITSGILRRAWNFRSGVLPSQQHIDELLGRIGWHRLRWERPLLSFPQPGMEIDFGGIVKEYAADRLATLCRNHGVSHGFVNLGGDIRIIGPQPDGSPWNVGIQHPRKKDTAIHNLGLHYGAIASSGDYERCITFDGVRYGHILNPKTGWPVRHLAAVTVVSDFCVVAGSASTIAMLKETEGPRWLASLGLPHLWVDVEGRAGGPLMNADVHHPKKLG
jgi:thiamine biosynthesis lipoprotein